jgi:hypothetical protein
MRNCRASTRSCTPSTRSTNGRLPSSRS